jgi:hypothetical protein
MSTVDNYFKKNNEFDFNKIKFLTGNFNVFLNSPLVEDIMFCYYDQRKMALSLDFFIKNFGEAKKEQILKTLTECVDKKLLLQNENNYQLNFEK